jgi:PhoPQ-activated pathogenicity-related protein
MYIRKLYKINGSDRKFATNYSKKYMSWIAWKVNEKDKSIYEKIDILYDLVNVGENIPTIKDIKGIEFPEEFRPFNWEEKTVASSKLEAAKIIF